MKELIIKSNEIQSQVFKLENELNELREQIYQKCFDNYILSINPFILDIGDEDSPGEMGISFYFVLHSRERNHKNEEIKLELEFGLNFTFNEDRCLELSEVLSLSLGCFESSQKAKIIKDIIELRENIFIFEKNQIKNMKSFFKNSMMNFFKKNNLNDVENYTLMIEGNCFNISKNEIENIEKEIKVGVADMFFKNSAMINENANRINVIADDCQDMEQFNQGMSAEFRLINLNKLKNKLDLEIKEDKNKNEVKVRNKL